MLYTNEEGITYDDGIDLRFKTETIKEYGPAHRLTLGNLKKWLVKYAADMPDDTPILYDNISEVLLLANGGWKVTPMLWDTFSTGDGEEKDYQPCIPAWQVFRTTDKDGNVGLVFTAHY